MKLTLKEKLGLIKEISANILEDRYNREIVLKGYHKTNTLLDGENCDVCGKNWEKDGSCISRTILSITIEEDDHLHVCKECKTELETSGTIEYSDEIKTRRRMRRRIVI
jgi:hypothetical protein